MTTRQSVDPAKAYDCYLRSVRTRTTRTNTNSDSMLSPFFFSPLFLASRRGRDRRRRTPLQNEMHFSLRTRRTSDLVAVGTGANRPGAARNKTDCFSLASRPCRASRPPARQERCSTSSSEERARDTERQKQRVLRVLPQGLLSAQRLGLRDSRGKQPLPTGDWWPNSTPWTIHAQEATSSLRSHVCLGDASI